MLQHQDRNVGPKDYAGLKDQLRITKVFYTIQGEGPYAGMPAVFVRLAGCNRGAKIGMGCEFCDTAFHFDEGKVVGFDNLLFQIESVIREAGRDPMEKPLIVFSGGEPLLQARNLISFLVLLNGLSYDSLQVESNGDCPLPGKFPIGFVTLVVSPKAVGGKHRPLKLDIMQAAHCLKFLIEDDLASAYYDVPEYARGGSKTWVQPMTAYQRQPRSPAAAWEPGVLDMERTARNHHRAAELAMRYGYRISMQQHLWLGVE